jgi:prolyl-tRNA synthetase
MKDAYSFDYTDAGLDASYMAQRDAYERIFQRLGLEYVIVQADAGAMGGSRSEEFLHPTAVGEDTFVRSAGGYAANVEAFTTVVPDAVEFDVDGAPVIFDSPNTPTIETLVAHSNAVLEGEYTAAHTLKNVVLALTHLDGTREVVVVGVPGDRDVDDKRVEVAFAPAEVEPATETDFAKHPLLVKGYIGPWSEQGQLLGEESATGIRYFLDPRVVDGSSWITGANIDQKHAHSVVAGRDFGSDGYVEVASVREGDPAPDGSGPVTLARGMEIGHVFQLGRKYADALGLQVLDENGKLVTVTMGSYGIGVTRILAIIAELNNDDKGLVWPASVAPFDVQVVATGKDSTAFDLAEKLSADLESAGFDVLYDDRPKVSPGVKFKDAELVGVPKIVIVGRGAADGEVELWDRRSGDREVVAATEAAARLTAQR